jgi:hypothetical protein
MNESGEVEYQVSKVSNVKKGQRSTSAPSDVLVEESRERTRESKNVIFFWCRRRELLRTELRLDWREGVEAWRHGGVEERRSVKRLRSQARKRRRELRHEMSTNPRQIAPKCN